MNRVVVRNELPISGHIELPFLSHSIIHPKLHAFVNIQTAINSETMYVSFCLISGHQSKQLTDDGIRYESNASTRSDTIFENISSEFQYLNLKYLKLNCLKISREMIAIIKNYFAFYSFLSIPSLIFFIIYLQIINKTKIIYLNDISIKMNALIFGSLCQFFVGFFVIRLFKSSFRRIRICINKSVVKVIQVFSYRSLFLWFSLTSY